MVVDQAPEESVPAVDPTEPQSSLSSFAPDGFVFQAPAGLSNFKFEPLTPRSADAFLTPRSVCYSSHLLFKTLESFVIL